MSMFPPWAEEDTSQQAKKKSSNKPKPAWHQNLTTKPLHQNARNEAVKYTTMLYNLKRQRSESAVNAVNAVDTLTLICLKTLVSHFRMTEISMTTAELHEIFTCIPTFHLSMLMSLLISKNLLRERSFSLFCRPDLRTATCVGLHYKTSAWEMCMPKYVTSTSFEGWMNVCHLNVAYSNIPLNVLSTIISHSNGLKELVVSGWRATDNSSKREDGDDNDEEDGNLRELSFSVLSVEKTREMDGISYINVDDCQWFDNFCLAELVRGRKLHSLRILSCRRTKVTLTSEQASSILQENGGVAVVQVDE